MIIRRIHLHNIRSYVDEEIKLDTGTVLFEGDIGSGKSSILMAIEFALFGTSEREFYSRLLRKGAKEGWVEIEFEHDGNIYAVYRSLEKGKKDSIRSGESYIVTPEGKMFLSPLEIKSKILGLMGVEVSSRKKKTLPIVKYAIYTPQEMMKEILMGDPEERKRVIRRIFRVDEYEVAREHAKQISSMLRFEIRALEGKREELERKEKDYEEERDSIAEIKKEIERLERKRREKKAEVEKLKEGLEKLKHKRKEHEELTREIERLRAQLRENLKERERELEELKELNKAEERVKALENDAKKYEELKKEIDKMRDKIELLHQLEKEERGLTGELKHMDELKSRRNELTEKIENTRKDIEKLRSTIKREEVERRRSEIEEKLRALQKTLGGVESKIRELEGELEEFSKLGAVCPKCKRPLTEEYKRELIMGTTKELEEKKKKRESLIRKIETLRNRRDAVDEELRRIQAMERKIAALEGEMRQYEEELKTVESALQRIEEEIVKLERVRRNIEELRDFEERYRTAERERKALEPTWREYTTLQGKLEKKEAVERSLKKREARIEKIRSDMEEKEKHVKALGYSEGEYRRVEDAYRNAYGEYGKIETRIEGMQKNLEEAENRCQELEREIERLRGEVERSEGLKRIKEWLDRDFQNALQEIEIQRMYLINEEFRTLFESWFRELMGESEYEATIDENFEPKITYEKYDMPIGSLSGGERTSVALAYRLALNTMVKRTLGLRTNILILDEPTDGFSKDQLYKLKDVFEKMETDQIIIVTHEKELINIADRVYHVEKVNGESRVTLKYS